MNCPKCGKEREENEKYCTRCGYNFEQPVFLKFDKPMKWYNFLVLIFFPLNIFMNFINGFSYIANPSVSSSDISGLGDVSRQALEKLNVFTGVCMLVIAVFMIYSLKCLRAFRKISLTCIISVYVSNMIVNIVNATMMYHILGKQATEVVVYLVYINIATVIFMIIANTVYFTKRKHIFVN